MIKDVLKYIYEDKVFLLALIFAVISVCLGDFQLSFINWQVIFSLFGMMLVLALFNTSGFLHQLSSRIVRMSANTRHIALWMVNIAFFFSMILSNDVAVLTLLPLYLFTVNPLDHFRGQISTAVLITVAANLGGIIFPFSNPQNLIIFIQKQMTSSDFLSMSLPLTVFSYLILIVLTFILVEEKSLNKTIDLPPLDRQKLVLASISFLLMAFAIMGFLPLKVVFILLAIFCLFYQADSYSQVDYRLLMTFACFFVIVANVSQWSTLRLFLEKNLRQATPTYLISLALSQFFSNVPTTILLEPFTPQVQALWYGVNIGGLGTYIASLANLIGIKIIRTYAPRHFKAYLKQFLILNVSIVFILTLFYFFSQL